MAIRTNTAAALIVCAGALALAPSGLAQEGRAAGASPLPAGPGRDIVAAACSQCHGLNAFTWLRQGDQAWRHQVYDMILRGSQISPGEIDTVVTYLTTNFGPGVNVPPSAPVNLPAGAGKEIVEGGCGICHGLDRTVGTARSPGEWQAIVAKMVFLGAPLAADQQRAAVDYLSNNFSSAARTAAAK
jgi:mono/diheme cytochrome c family protein